VAYDNVTCVFLGPTSLCAVRHCRVLRCDISQLLLTVLASSAVTWTMHVARCGCGLQNCWRAHEAFRQTDRQTDGRAKKT